MPQTRIQKVYPFQHGGVFKFLFIHAKEETADSTLKQEINIFTKFILTMIITTIGFSAQCIQQENALASKYCCNFVNIFVDIPAEIPAFSDLKLINFVNLRDGMHSAHDQRDMFVQSWFSQETLFSSRNVKQPTFECESDGLFSLNYLI